MKRFFIFTVAILAIGAAAYFFYSRNRSEPADNQPEYEFSQVERKTILNLVSATGTLAARDLVEVGTQVSGTLQEVLVDFNDTVEAGQLIALIDPSVLDTQVKTEKANVLRMEGQLLQAQNDLDRFKPLHDDGFLTDSEFTRAEIAVQIAEANLMSAEAGLDRAMRNRAYAEIRAPIAGIVIDRTVEPGQTVAASLSAPRLFTIANDLSKMEILASVDESDIGQIQIGQEVRFTVAAYIDDTFTGEVEEIRLSPTVIQNVVNYTVVVTAENPDRRLLPGMTATLDFVIAEVENALSVPSGALSLRPNAAMMAVLQERRAQRQAGGGGQGGQGGFGGGSSGGGGFGGPGGGRRADMGMLWYVQDGQLQLMPVRKGVSDGVRTEVIPLREMTIEEGTEIISKVVGATASPANSNQGGPPSGLRRLGF